MLIQKVIFELGTFQLYILQTFQQTLQGDNFHQGYYWRDGGSPQGYGPFSFILTALEHYKTVTLAGKKSAKDSQENKTGQLLRVDFYRKKLTKEEIT